MCTVEPITESYPQCSQTALIHRAACLAPGGRLNLPTVLDMDTKNRETVFLITASALVGALASRFARDVLSKMRVRLYWEPRSSGSETEEAEAWDQSSAFSAYGAIPNAEAAGSDPADFDLSSLYGSAFSPPPRQTVAEALTPVSGSLLGSEKLEDLMPRPTRLSPVKIAKEHGDDLAA